MERRQLEYLVAIADTGSVTAAAQLLHVAQPGVSTQLALLERELGERVFDRDRHGARPTAVGAVVVERARLALAALAEVRTAVEQARGLLTGGVAVGTVRGVPLGELAGALGRFHRRHPGVELRLVEAESDQLLAELAGGRLDVALVGVPGPLPPGLRGRTVLQDRLAVLVADDHPWAGRRRLLLADLAGTTLATLPAGTGTRDALDAALRRAGVHPRTGFEAGTTAAVLELAAAGLAAAVLPSRAVATAAGLHVVPLAPAVTSRLVLATADPRRRSPGPAARALLAEVLAAPVDPSR